MVYRTVCTISMRNGTNLPVGAMAGRFEQRIGGFPTSQFPVCNGNEQTLSECTTLDRNGAECNVDKVFVKCSLRDSDGSMCDISTEPHFTTTDSSTMGEPYTSTVMTDSTGTIIHSLEHTIYVVSTRESRTNQNMNNVTVIISASVGVIFGVTLFASIVICMTLVYLRCKSTMSCMLFKADVQRNANVTNSHTTESCLYSEMIDKSTEEHQKAYSFIYDNITDCTAELSKIMKTSHTCNYCEEEDTTDHCAVAPKESTAHNINETRRKPGLCYEATSNAAKDHWDMPIIADTVSR